MTLSAKRMNVAQPALSQSMKKLETELNIELFERRGRNIHLTKAGKYLQKQISPIIDSLESLPEDIKEYALDEARSVDIGMYSASKLVLNAIAAYKRKYPKTKFRISQSDDESSNDISIYTVLNSSKEAGKDDPNIHFFSERIGVALPKKLASQGIGELSDLACEQFVLLAGSKGFRKTCDALCAAKGFIMHDTIESDSPDVVRKLIGLGLGVGFWPEYSWGKLEGSNADFVPLDNKEFVRTIAVKLNSNSTNSKEVNRFFDFLLQEMRSTFNNVQYNHHRRDD